MKNTSGFQDARRVALARDLTGDVTTNVGAKTSLISVAVRGGRRARQQLDAKVFRGNLFTPGFPSFVESNELQGNVKKEKEGAIE